MKLEPTRETQLVERALGGNSDAFGELVSRYHRIAFSIAYRMTGNRVEAEDLCQDVFLKVHRSLARFDRSLPFGPWLRKITSNAALNHLRHRGVERRVLEDAGEGEGEGESERSVAEPGAGPEERLARSETADRLGCALAKLPDNQRLAFTLKYVEELTAEEIAEAMDAPKNTVKTWLLRAREALRKDLADDL